MFIFQLETLRGFDSIAMNSLTGILHEDIFMYRNFLKNSSNGFLLNYSTLFIFIL